MHAVDIGGHRADHRSSRPRPALRRWRCRARSPRRLRRCALRARRAGAAASSMQGAAGGRRACSLASAAPCSVDHLAREVRRELLAERRPAAPRTSAVSARPTTPTHDSCSSLQHAAGALGDVARLAFGLRTSAAAIAAFLRVEAARVLAEERLRQRVDADDLAAVRHRIEVGLEDLALLPRRLEARRGHDLAELLRHAAAAGGPRQAVVDRGRRAASSRSRRRGCGCSRGCPRRSWPRRSSRRRPCS